MAEIKKGGIDPREALMGGGFLGAVSSMYLHVFRSTRFLGDLDKPL